MWSQGPRTAREDGVGPVICPFCHTNDDKVIDSRSSDGGRVVRRRRQCLGCNKRFTTYERIEQAARITVIKRDDSRVPFNPEKIYAGIAAACGKRAIPEAVKRRLTDEVEDEVHREYDREVESRIIGEKVMGKLRDVDEVVLIRFASEYYPGSGLDDIKKHIEELNSSTRTTPNQQSLFLKP